MATPQRAGAGRAHPKTDMTDHLHLVNQLAHHDAAISAFGSRMTAVESTLGHVQDKLSNVDSRMQTGFAAIEGLIKEDKASKGPGLIEIIKLAVSLVALGAAAATIITFLVTSHVAPSIQKLDDKTSYLSDLRARDEVERQAELAKLREQKDEAVQETIEQLRSTVEDMKTNKVWNQITIKKGS